MVKNNFFSVLFFFCISVSITYAQQQTYFVKFKDKASNTYSISTPQDFLSYKAIQRRQKCRVAIDDKDLPVSQFYIDQVVSAGAQLLYPLKWLNGIVVKSDVVVKSQLSLLSFVELTEASVKRVSAPGSGIQNEFSASQMNMLAADFSFTQNNMLGMPHMNADGYNGNGITIAITDDGFLRADTMKAFEHLFMGNQIIDTWDLVDLDKSVYSQGGGHGSHVFSILAGYLEDKLYAAGRGASFILFRTEESGAETPLEELNWVRAAEIADSMGADIIQVSLGYNTFDNSSLDYTMGQLNGTTSYSSQGATVAASRGIVVVVSAGNTGNSSWNKILCPADAIGILTVGAVDFNRERAAFSSIGYTADGRVKPDVMAMGAGTTYATTSSNTIAIGSGTSFASPLISAFCAGLMQAFPQLTHDELIHVVKQSADRADHPDPYYGYGIPNYEKAFSLAQLILDKQNDWVFPNPIGANLHVKIKDEWIGKELEWQLSTATGQRIVEGKIMTENPIVHLFGQGDILSTGLYILKVSYKEDFSIFKVIK